VGAKYDRMDMDVASAGYPPEQAIEHTIIARRLAAEHREGS